jgi:hypothetical protein
VIVVDRLFVGGLLFVLDKIASAVDAELNDESVLTEELLTTQLRLELGEIDEAEAREREREITERLRAMREARGEPTGAIEIAGRQAEVEVDFTGAPRESEEDDGPP